MLLEARAVAAKARQLESSTPQEILAFAHGEYAPRIAISTAFGVEGCALIHMASEIGIGVRVFTVDTGYLFDEAIELREQLATRYDLDLTVFEPSTSTAAVEEALGVPPWQQSTDECCAVRKVEPTARALRDLDGWVAGLRRDQAGSRRNISLLEAYAHEDGSPFVKIHPLANWTRVEVWRYVLDNKVPYNPLLDAGYPSIGCRPCTNSVGADGGERSGRWGGEKEECGIHTFLVPLGAKPSR